MRAPRSVTLQPMARPSRTLNDAIALRAPRHHAASGRRSAWSDRATAFQSFLSADRLAHAHVDRRSCRCAAPRIGVRRMPKRPCWSLRHSRFVAVYTACSARGISVFPAAGDAERRTDFAVRLERQRTLLCRPPDTFERRRDRPCAVAGFEQARRLDDVQSARLASRGCRRPGSPAGWLRVWRFTMFTLSTEHASRSRVHASTSPARPLSRPVSDDRPCRPCGSCSALPCLTALPARAR
jgi:hypothetical protein